VLRIFYLWLNQIQTPLKKFYLLIASCCVALAINAQTFWTEGFGTGCNRGTLASSYTGTNGAWVITATGINDPQANQWFVSGTCINTGVNNCSGDCQTSAGTNATLHLSNTHIVITTPISYNLAADTGCSYFTGGLAPYATCNTNTRAESPVINCTGKSNITLSFLYLMNGQAATDFATLMYYNGTTWAALTPALTITTNTCTAPAGQWTAYSCTLPASANNNASVKIGFNWVNNDDGTGNDPSFAVDDITLATTPTGIQNYDATALQVFAAGKNISITSAQPVKLASVIDMLGRTIPSALQNNMISLEDQPNGIYFIRLLVNGELVTRKVYIQ
jgi:hypothetical protein